jgi:hypothetical protein
MAPEPCWYSVLEYVRLAGQCSLLSATLHFQSHVGPLKLPRMVDNEIEGVKDLGRSFMPETRRVYTAEFEVAAVKLGIAQSRSAAEAELGRLQEENKRVRMESGDGPAQRPKSWRMTRNVQKGEKSARVDVENTRDRAKEKKR